MAVGLSVPLGWIGAADPAKTAAYVDPPSGGPSCRLLLAACSPVGGFAGMGVDPASGAGRLMAGSIESPEFANSLALRLPAWRLGGRWDVLGPPPGALPRKPSGTTVLLFLVDSAVLSSLSSAGVTCKVEIALIKANSCFSIAAAGALLPQSVKRFALHSLYTMKMSPTLSLRTITDRNLFCVNLNSLSVQWSPSNDLFNLNQSKNFSLLRYKMRSWFPCFKTPPTLICLTSPIGSL